MEMRQLLESAASAGGIELDLSIRPDGKPLCCSDRGLAIPDVPGWWNPLDRDGDAMRLASKLRIGTRHEPDAVLAGWERDQPGAPTHDGKGPWYWKEWLHGNADVAAATRKAIVQAAAMKATASTPQP